MTDTKNEVAAKALATKAHNLFNDHLLHWPGEEDMIVGGATDASDLLEVAAFVALGDFDTAWTKVYELDTIVRDAVADALEGHDAFFKFFKE